LLVQTPAYPEGQSLAELRDRRHKFPMMLDQNEHLYLFSKPAVRELFRRLEVAQVEFIPAIFSFYDMSFAASGKPMEQFDEDEQSAALCRTIGGRFMQAMLDLDHRRLNLLEKYRELARAQSLALG
jgi:hypothetical protein